MSTDDTTTIDVKGQNCPMPVIKTKGAFEEIADGETLEVLSTDSGSMNDIAGWADATDGAELVDQEETIEGGEDVYRHYVRKVE